RGARPAARSAVAQDRGRGAAAVALLTAAIETLPRQAATAGPAPLEQLVAVQEAERQRIARELHDWMGQDVTALSLGLKQLEASLVAASDRDLLSRLQSLTVQIGGHLHRIAWELRPTSLDDLGLARALETHAAGWSERVR